MKLKLLILLLLFSVSAAANAQTDIPLVIHINGQLYRWSIGDSAPTFTGCDLQGNRLRLWDYSLVQSSQGDWTAFMVLPQDMLDGAPTPTGNLWVCNVNTGEAYALSFFNPGLPNAVMEGAFSPDGTRIVWTEINKEEANPATADMFVHDFATKETTTIVDSILLTYYCGIGVGAPRVIWGEAGIVVGYALTAEADPCSEVVEIGFSHFAEDGTLLNSFPVEYARFELFEWLTDSEPRIAFLGRIEGTNDTQMFTLNMTTGAVETVESSIEAFIPNTDASAGRYLLSNMFYIHNPPLIYLPFVAIPLETDADVALSADGETVAIVFGHTLYFAQNGTLEPASWNMEYYPMEGQGDGIHIPDNREGQFEIAWAAPSYRLVPTPQSVCPNVDQLYVGAGVRIVRGLGANNLRDAPFPSAALIGSIPEGSNLFVVDIYNFSPFNAPPVDVCSEGIRWREVIYDDQRGWTAESQDDTYYMVGDE